MKKQLLIHNKISDYGKRPRSISNGMNTSFRKNTLTLLTILVFSLTVGLQVAFAQSTDLVSQWNGDEVSRTSAGVVDVLDTEGDNNGILYDTRDTTPGEIGNAFNLSGANEYVRIGNPANLNFGTGPFSLEAWFNWSGSKASYANANNIIRKSNYPVDGPGAGYWLRISIPRDSGTKEMELEFFVGETVGIRGQPRGVITTPVSPGVWHHSVATRDSSGTMKLYVDGELKGTAKAPNANTTSGAPFTIGGWVDRFGATEFFSGLIGEISVYDRALDSPEVESIYSDIVNDLELYSKIEPYIKSNETPGQCMTVRGCQAYCDMEENFDECLDFAYKAGLIKTEDPYLLALQSGEGPGGCVGEDACAEYCGEAANIKECVAFLEKFGVIAPGVLQELQEIIVACEQESDFVACIDSAMIEIDELVELDVSLKIGVDLSQSTQALHQSLQEGEGPGGCKDEVSCRTHCEDINNLSKCVSFMEKFNLIPPDELEEMRHIASAKDGGVSFPGNCKTKESCLQYCENAGHQIECMEFAQKAGLLKGEDVEAVSRILPYLRGGGKLPGGCTTKESCDAYCGVETHINECSDFAVKAGFMSKEEAEIMKKTGGKGPGNCKSREACDAYCKDEAHVDECVDFAVKAGFISAEEAEMAKKFKITSGPGGCKSKAECEAFCAVNQEVCIEWGKEHGMDMGGGQGGPGNAEECAKYGGNWDGKKCELGASECVKQGGIWGPDNETGKETCNFSGEMGQDNRKEFEACLGKATCVEFNLCFDAIPKGDQQQSGQGGQQFGQGEQQEPQDETGRKIKARVMACFEEKMDSCLVLSCSEFGTCLKSFQQGGGEQGGDQQQQGQGAPNPKVDAKINACQKELQEIKMKEVQEKMDACLSRSCSEFESCLRSVQPSGGDQNGEQAGQQQGQGTPDPAVDAKVQTCQKEKVNACLTKSCDEFQACLNSLGGGGDSGGQQQSAPDPAVQAKFMSCFPPPSSSLPLPSLLGAVFGPWLLLFR